GTPAAAPGPEGGRAPEGPQENVWVAAVRRNPEHARGYAERWRRIEASGQDIYGEARLIDAMAPRGARILDAGCGSGRLGGYLARAGHHVTGVDLDPHLIEVAREDHPEAHWYVGDLAQLDLRDQHVPAPAPDSPVAPLGEEMAVEDGQDRPSAGADERDQEGTRLDADLGEPSEQGPRDERARFDLALCAGNVLTFLSVVERRPALAVVAAHARPPGRLGAGVWLRRGSRQEEREPWDYPPGLLALHRPRG